MLMTKLAKGVALPSVVINSFNLSTVTVGTKYDAMRTSFTGVYVTEVSAQDTWVVTAKLTFTSVSTCWFDGNVCHFKPMRNV